MTAIAALYSICQHLGYFLDISVHKNISMITDQHDLGIVMKTKVKKVLFVVVSRKPENRVL